MQFRKKRSKQLSLDITPLIDVIFLLLIFFMISTTFISYNEIKIKLPEAATRTDMEPVKPLEVTIARSGGIFIDNQRIPPEKLKETLNAARKKSRRSTLVIRADGRVPHKNVVRVMDIAKMAGIEKLSIATVLQP